MTHHLDRFKTSVTGHWRTLGLIVILIWIIELADAVIPGVQLDRYGIRPHTIDGLRNILFAPFLHRGLAHVLANTAPFFILGWLTMMRSQHEFWTVTLISGLVSGLGIWLFGSPTTIHLGMSGVIFGYLGYLLARGYFERSPLALALALIALFSYGSIIWGILPLRSDVSWLGHLFGLVGGAFAAYRLANEAKR